MSQTTDRVRWTIQDVAALPDNEWIRYEIIDGELFVTRSPHHKHQHVIGCIFSVLNTWSLETGLGEPSIMPGLIFSDSDNVAPDVVWVSYERLAQIQDDAGHFCGAPELVVEVLSSGKANEDRDRLAKLKLYSVQGVQEYWIVDRIAQRIEVYRRENAQLKLVTTLLVVHHANIDRCRLGKGKREKRKGFKPLPLTPFPFPVCQKDFGRLLVGDVITSPLLPNFACEVSRLFVSRS